MKKNTSKLTKRLIQYGALSAVVASIADVNGQVIYTDENPDFMGGIGDLYFLDLNNDDIDDFRIFHNGANSLFINPLTANNGVLGSGSYSLAYPFALSTGDPISSGAGTFWNNGYSSGNQSLNYGSCSYGNWCGVTDRYLGFEFDINGATHYGWARLDVNDDGSVWIVKDYAYEATAGLAIAAGDTGGGNNGMPPEITCPTNIELNTDPELCSTVVTYPDATATDPDEDLDTIEQIDPDPAVLSSGDEFPVGTTTVTFRATDLEGNMTDCSFDIIVSDAEAPVIICPDNMAVPPAETNGVFTVPNYFDTGDAIATDNCTDPVNTSQDPVPGTELADGTYTVTLTATDDAGNTTSCDFELTVDSTLGIDNETLNTGISLYPSLAQNEINLVNRSNIELNKASIFDLNGRLINRVNLSNLDTEKTINITKLTAGLYFIQIESNEGITIKRFIKK